MEKVKEKNIVIIIFFLEFEGEYLNGEKNGKEKEYYLNNKLQYEGEYLNGKRNGKGKEYFLRVIKNQKYLKESI